MQKKWYHLIFVAVCVAVLVVLLRAPEVSTPRLPNTDAHRDRRNYQACPTCHERDSAHPMPEDHEAKGGGLRPDHAKCYFCHKPEEK